MLAACVVAPVGVEVAVVDQCAEFQHCFGAGESPAGAGDVEAVTDQMPAGAFDGAGGGRPTRGQGDSVASAPRPAVCNRSAKPGRSYASSSTRSATARICRSASDATSGASRADASGSPSHASGRAPERRWIGAQLVPVSSRAH